MGILLVISVIQCTFHTNWYHYDHLTVVKRTGETVSSFGSDISSD